MTGAEVISELKKKFRVSTDKALSEVLGISISSVRQWKSRSECTSRQIADLVRSALKNGAVRFRTNAVRPLVEFYQIDGSESGRGANYVLFDALDEKGKKHPYKSGLKEELDSQHGVYVFFDSRGQAIYAGKAKRQSLWKEMNHALNRDRGRLQSIKRVKHPETKREYRTSGEKTRQIVHQSVTIWDLAVYFSAYEVADEMIEDVEALLVRSFANNLLNKKMEHFERHRKDRSNSIKIRKPSK